MFMCNKIIFRNDDVNANTNKEKLSEFYGIIHSIFPEAEIWSCITLFAGSNTRGSVYGELPLKIRNTDWFYKNADRFMYDYRHPMYKIASHGLYHIDHSKVSRDAQEMSILGSCSYLNTKIFVPPFNKFNQDTIDICSENNIYMKLDDWKSLKYNDFDKTHKFWYLHTWEYTEDSLRKKLNG